MANGVLWNTLFQGDEDNIRHVLYGSMLWRDWYGQSTSLTGFSPFDSDGNLVDTLFSSSNPGGPWYDVGYLDEKGLKIAQKLETKPTMVMQSRWPARFDYTSETEEISTVLMENNPIVDALRDNHPLSTVQPIGTPGYSSAEPVDRDIFFRQLLMIGVDNRFSDAYYIVRVYPKVVITDFGDTVWNAGEAATLPIQIMAIPDPYTIPPDGVTVGSPRWILRGGPAWLSQGTPVEWPSPQTPPVAAASTTAGEATVSFAEPVSPAGATFSYNVTAKNTTNNTSSLATLVGTPSVSSGTVTLTVGDLVSGDSYTFVVTASASGAMPSSSLPSNSVTVS